MTFGRLRWNVARYKWLVFTNCAPGSDAEFNRWYDEVHVPDLLRVPGIVKVHRTSVAGPQIVMLESGELAHSSADHIPFRYLAIYEFETDDPRAVLEEVRARANTPEMEISPLLGNVYTALYEDR
jgi:hypothetical protein